MKNFLLLNTLQIEKFVSENKLDSSYIHQASLGVYTCLQEFKNDKDITGIDNYVLKPIHLQNLLSIIDVVVEKLALENFTYLKYNILSTF